MYDFNQNRRTNRLYKSWIGAKGNVGVCPEWLDFKIFEKWAIDGGWEDGQIIKRKDNSKPFSPDNCYHFIKATREKDPLYKCWNAMRSEYKENVCSEWTSFDVFKDWAIKAGWQKSYRMYRKDNNKPYSPENCYYEECTHNNRVDAVVSYKGKEYTLKELSQHPNCEVGYDILSNRIFQYGMSPEKSLSKDYAPEAFRNLNKEITAFGETKTAKEWSLDFRCKVSYYKLVDRVFRNFTDPEMAMATNNHLTYRKSSCELTLKQIKDKCNELLGGTYAVVGEFSEFYGVSGIYGIFNTISGKIYVGQAISKDGIGGRLSEHQWDLEKNQHDNIHLQRSWNKRGDHAFAFLMLETFKEVTPDTATQRECFWINYFGSKNDDLGYNINDPKNGRLGITNRKITTEQVKSWIKMFINDNDKLPSCIDTSSIIYDELGISWKNLDQNLRRGFNGFPGQQTLKQITHEVISKKHINKNKISKRKSNGNKEQQ